jgi:EAL domain-containing protein (putative c-di-GMP-specific phosphodiesterase class I)
VRLVFSLVALVLAPFSWYLATKGFLLIPKEDDGGVLSCQTQVMGNSDEIRDMVGLLEVINENRVYSYFQPIIELDSKRTVGWEALGRASTRHGPVNPGILFSLAQQSRAEMRLSEIFRESALHCTECRFCWPHQQKSYMFINIHPTELAEGKFIEILDQIVANNTNDYLQTVVELPESWVGNTHEMQRIVKQIRDRKLLVAYDDFGAGQSRIPDLINVPPDFIKLDRQLISRIEENKVKRSLVKAVVDACNELKVKTLAEGIETIDEMNGCVDLGVDLGQGFLICKPQPAFQLFSAEPKQIPQACPFVRLDMLPK